MLSLDVATIHELASRPKASARLSIHWPDTVVTESLDHANQDLLIPESVFNPECSLVVSLGELECLKAPKFRELHQIQD